MCFHLCTNLLLKIILRCENLLLVLHSGSVIDNIAAKYYNKYIYICRYICLKYRVSTVILYVDVQEHGYFPNTNLTTTDAHNCLCVRRLVCLHFFHPSLSATPVPTTCLTASPVALVAFTLPTQRPRRVCSSLVSNAAAHVECLRSGNMGQVFVIPT